MSLPDYAKYFKSFVIIFLSTLYIRVVKETGLYGHGKKEGDAIPASHTERYDILFYLKRGPSFYCGYSHGSRFYYFELKYLLN